MSASMDVGAGGTHIRLVIKLDNIHTSCLLLFKARLVFNSFFDGIMMDTGSFTSKPV